MFIRALRLRCPLCGERHIFERWGQLVDRCPQCAYSYEREDGYWVGAMIMNLAGAMAAFFVLLMGAFVRYGASPPPQFLWVAAAAMIVLPIVCYPRSKTLWVAVDLRIHPYSPDERPDR